MSDLATPSAAAIGTMDASAIAPAKGKQQQHAVKPERPDDEQYKKDLAVAEKEHAAAQQKLNDIKAKLDNARPNNKDSPAGKRQAELRAELSTIRQQQSGFKNSRQSTLEKVKQLDEKLKARMNEQKAARSKFNFKSADDMQREIDRLQKQVDTGTMKLVDEKKMLSDISMLHKQKKGFAALDETEKHIASIKAEIAEHKKGLDNPEAKALSAKYDEIQAELGKIKDEQDDAFKNVNQLRDERTKAHDEQQKKYMAVREIKDNYYSARRAFKAYEDEAYRIRKEKHRAEKDAYEKEKRRQVASQKLEDASAPAYGVEIGTAEGLIRYFDPNSAAAKTESGPGKFAASVQRTVDDTGFKGMKVSKKDDDEAYFIGGGGKKKKGKKGGKAESPAPGTPTEGKFNLNIGVIEDLGKIGVDPPSTQADVPGVVEKIKEKLAKWKDDQERKTKENIAKAQKEIDRLEADAANGNDERSTDHAKKPAQANAGVNGTVSAEAELQQARDAVADATEELKAAKLEDRE